MLLIFGHSDTVAHSSMLAVIKERSERSSQARKARALGGKLPPSRVEVGRPTTSRICWTNCIEKIRPHPMMPIPIANNDDGRPKAGGRVYN